ncbi:membrane protein insertion efficiency factor YidD [Candidatus Woesebacteria bacterium]|nr:membrane protein insertion efficiency factor YidD [Candidatus Woesebacteria bacterium]
MKKLFILLIELYRVSLSPILVNLFGHGCRYQPTCSEYAKEAVEKFGAVKGSFLAVKRLSKCHPFSVGGYDPVI